MAEITDEEVQAAIDRGDIPPVRGGDFALGRGTNDNKATSDTFDADKCAYSSAAMGVCGAARDHHGNGGPILYHAFVPPQKIRATNDTASGWNEREEAVQSVLLQCAENGIPITRHAVRIILEQISQNREALDFLARH